MINGIQWRRTEEGDALYICALPGGSLRYATCSFEKALNLLCFICLVVESVLSPRGLILA